MEELAEEERAKGREEGREEGRKEGREEGTEMTMLSSIKNLMESLNLTLEQAMNALKVPADQREKFAAKL